MKKEFDKRKVLFTFMDNLAPWQRNLIETASIALVTYMIFSTIFMPGKIPSESMEPTLNVGDIVIANGLAYLTKEPQRGDIVIFQSDTTDNITLIKRVIGLPGDTIVFIEGCLYINGELLYEDYLPENMKSNSYTNFEVPPDSYFVMGDNRTSSYDSRSWVNPYISRKNIKGKLLVNIPMSKLNKGFFSLFSYNID